MMITKVKQYNKNIKLEYIFTVASSFNVTNGFWLIYLASKGMSLAWIGILEGVFHVTSLLMETPTGVVADLVGRKFSRQLGILLLIVYSILLLMGTEKWHYVIAFIICALSYDLESGAGEALIYDSLKVNNREKDYMKVSGIIEVCMQGSGSIALILGGYLAVKHYDLPFIVSIAVGGIAFIISMYFREVPLENKPKYINIIEAIKEQYITSYRFMKNEHRIVFFAIVLNIMGTFVTIAFFYMQNYWKDMGMGEGTIGILLALHGILAAAGGYFAHRIEKKLGEKKLIIVGSIILMTLYWLLCFKVGSWVAIVLIGFVDSVLYVVLSTYINHLIPSEQRATLLSFSSMIFSFFMIIFFPIVGILGDILGLSYTFLILAAILTLISLRIIYKVSR